MTKFSPEDKLAAVRRYLNGNESFAVISSSIGTAKSEVIKWVQHYQHHGVEAFIKSYTGYSVQFKLDVLNYMNEQGTSIRETAARFNIPTHSSLIQWKKQVEWRGIDALEPKKKGRPSMQKKNQNAKKDQLPAKGSLEALQAENERLRMENAYFKKVECLSSKQGKITKQDKIQVIYELRHEYPVKAILKLADIPRSTYYYYVKNFGRPDLDRELKQLIRTIYDDHEGRLGYRRIRDELRNQEHQVNHKKVQRIMKELGLKSLVRLKKYRSYKGTVGKIAPNLLNRNFKAEKPCEKWVTDITEIKLFGEKLYFSPILDLFNGEIITYTIGSRPAYSLVSTMLEQAFQQLTDDHNLMIHSDQGWHYQMKQYQHALEERGITQSMSRKGNCYDNAVIESFFGILKSELLYLKEFHSVEHFKSELASYIEYYNHKRIKAKLKGMSPVQYRTYAQAAA
ncbi:IS3 family transposase [Brevibacillus fortis]|uniref:IS3 family transposase n=1 Tax=Brevibacillus fortis TaxID=2126352 RepID=UPI002E1C66E0|nr:IS3 family transposase [Brevibacillus fortis]